MIRRTVSLVLISLVAVGIGPALAETGDLDPSFGGDGWSVARFHYDGFGNTAALDPEGRLVVAGTAGARFPVARFLPNGELDPSFGNGGTTKIAQGQIFDVAILSDGRIVAVGGNRDGWVVCRLTESGDLDPTFGDGGVADVAFDSGEAKGVALAADGRIVVVGQRGADAVVARYRPRGVLDAAFSGDGRRIVRLVSTTPLYAGDELNAVAAMGDGGLVAAGLVDDGWMGVIRLDADGDLVPSFGVGGAILEDLSSYQVGYSVMVQGERILVGGRLEDTRLAVFAYTGDGVPDRTFGGDGVTSIEVVEPGPDTVVFGADMAMDPSGRLVLAGTIVAGDRTFDVDIVVARLDRDGEVDTTFGDEGVVTVPLHFDEDAAGVAVRPGGQIVIGGTRTGAKANMMLAVQLQA